MGVQAVWRMGLPVLAVSVGVWRSLVQVVPFGLAAIFVRCMSLVCLPIEIDRCGLVPACGIWWRLFALSQVLPLFEVLGIDGVCFFLRLCLCFWLFWLSGQFAAN